MPGRRGRVRKAAGKARRKGRWHDAVSEQEQLARQFPVTVRRVDDEVTRQQDKR